jgi:ankyrin repeat protein
MELRWLRAGAGGNERWRLHPSDLAALIGVAAGLSAWLLYGVGEGGAQRELIGKGWLYPPIEKKRDAAGKLTGNARDFARSVCQGVRGEAAKAFLKAGFSPNGADGSPLLASASVHCLDAMRTLLDAGADPNAAPRGQKGVILFATAAEGNREGLKLLLERGARLEAGLEAPVAVALLKAESDPRKHYGRRIEDTVAFLASLRLDLQREDEKGDSLLHVAVREENAAAIDALLERGAGMAKPNKAGEVPWLLAADLFLSDSSCVRESSNLRPPWTPDKERDARLRETLLRMLSRVADLKQRDGRGRTLAFYLARDLPLLREYLAKGLSFDVVDERFMTPWDLVAPQDLATLAAEHPELTRLKVMEGAKARSLLHVAVGQPSQHWRLIDRLTAEGYPVNAVDGVGDTPLLALFYGAPTASGYRRRFSNTWSCTDDRLAKHDTWPQSPDSTLPNPYEHVLERLLKAGANPNLAGADGRPPLAMAVLPNMAALLLAHGADPRASVGGRPILALFEEESGRGNRSAREIAELIAKAQARPAAKPRQGASK